MPPSWPQITNTAGVAQALGTNPNLIRQWAHRQIITAHGHYRTRPLYLIDLCVSCVTIYVVSHSGRGHDCQHPVTTPGPSRPLGPA